MQNIFKRNKIQAFILDMDGVFVDTEPIQIDAFRMYLKKNNIPFTEKLLRSFIGISVEDNIKQIISDLTENKKLSLNKGVRERNMIYLGLLVKKSLRTMAGIDDVINYCVRNKILLGLATSSPAEQVDAVLSRIQGAFTGKYKSIFQAIVNGQEVIYKKPAPDIYHLICKKLNIKENWAVSLEDSPAGVRSARRAGLISIGITNEYYNQRDLAYADIVIDSPSEILFML
jgi:beta-phosphoglucomutase-like phosphatase (HAD superfamily)